MESNDNPNNNRKSISGYILLSLGIVLTFISIGFLAINQIILWVICFFVSLIMIIISIPIIRKSQRTLTEPSFVYDPSDEEEYINTEEEDNSDFDGKTARQNEIDQLKHEIEKEKLKKELENTKPKFCEYCGHKNEGNAKMCECCGAPLDK